MSTSPRRPLIWFLAFFQLLLGLLLTQEAFAANRKVCFRMRVYDDRPNLAITDGGCPQSGADGALRPCTPGQYRDFVGGVFELWDKDTGQPGESGGDDYIGTYVATGNHPNGVNNCVTFNWEGASYQADGEQHPDLYIIARPRVSHIQGLGPRVEIRDDFNQPFFPVSYRDTAVVNNCANTSCSMPFYLDLTYTGMQGWELESFMILDSAQHMLNVYGSLMAGSSIVIHYQNAFCNGSSTGATANNRNEICMNPGRHFLSAAHELGHVLQMRLFGQDTLVNVVSGPHFINTPCGSDSCATTEGWADYVALRSWWDPDNTSSTPFYFNNAMDPDPDVHAYSSCPINRTVEGQVAKSFWDLDDARNEAAGAPSGFADTTNLATIHIAQVWDLFPYGYDDRETLENDMNGVNMWDYYAWGSSDTDRFTTLLYHNCVENQDVF